jgi:hypothetical protein
VWGGAWRNPGPYVSTPEPPQQIEQGRA